MTFNPRTLKTVLGYAVSLIEKYTGVSLKQNKLTSIYNYLPINPNLATSGQPTANQLNSIKAAGSTKIINLGPPAAENSLANEASILSKIGIDYISIPVDFGAPSEQDFQQFASHMQNHKDQKIWVHCAANMRVSCFIFRYRTAILGENLELAEADLRKIWHPNTVWKKFISTPATL
ncbi:MAG: protein tyrosine phosphatase family protein [Porticoccaceae bacterium]|nr:protein tyrosine phosphatase family protein [Porticoccaceae bacterium]